jgi:biopolymer transport protein TolQ
MGQDMNIFHIILQSGIVVQFVLLLLIAASVFSWAIIFQKRKYLRQVQVQDEDFLRQFMNNDNHDALYQQLGDYPLSSHAPMFKKGFEEYQNVRSDFEKRGKVQTVFDFLKDSNVQPLERSLKTGAAIANQSLDQRLPILASIGSITPFVGLLGTVWGIINSFTGLATGGGSIEAVAPGIAEALVATAVGLFAAIPAVWFYNILNSEVSEIQTKMESFGQTFINQFERKSYLESKSSGSNGISVE